MTYRAVAIVEADGSVQPAQGRAGAAIVGEHPELLKHSAAMLEAGIEGARYAWQASDGRWLSVEARRREEWDEHPAAIELVLCVLDSLPHDLSPRELDVLTLAAGGLSNPEIGVRLEIAAGTVAKHFESILHKLGQQGRAGATAVAVDRGLLRLPVPGGGRSLEALPVGVLDQFLARTPGSASRYQDRARRPIRPRPARIGSLLPSAGPVAADGREHRRGSELAIAELNARGGVAGRPVELVPAYTDLFDAAALRGALADLFAADVDAITVPYLYSNAEACEAVGEYGAPYMHGDCSPESIELVRNSASLQQVFHICPPLDHYGGGFLRVLDELVAAGHWHPPNRQIGLVETEIPAGIHVAEEPIYDRALEAGWEIDFVETVSAPETDWGPVLARIRERSPAAILLAHDFPADGAAFQRAFAATPFPTLICAVYTPSIPQFLDEAGGAADGLLWSTVTGVYHDRFAGRFRRAYEARFGEAPGFSQAGIAYDEVGLLANAWSMADNPWSFKDVGDILRSRPFRGVNGGYSFDTAGQHNLSYPEAVLDPSVGQAHLVYQVQGGRHRIVAPQPFAHASFELPRWVT